MFLKSSDRLAIVDFDNSHISHKDLIQNINYLTKKIPNIDSKNIIIFMENRKEWIYSFFSVWNLLKVPIVVDAQSNQNEMSYFIEDSNSKLIIVSNKTLDIAKDAIEQEDIQIFNIDDVIFNKDEIKNEKEEIIHSKDLNETAVMLYTSGTTSLPKAVMLSFNNIYNEIESIRDFEVDKPAEKNDQSISILPFHHILPLMVNVLYFMHHEYSTVLISKLNSSVILEAFAKNRVTLFVAVPRIYKLFYQTIKNKINSSFITRTLFSLAKKINSKKFSKLIFSKVHKMFGPSLKYLLSGGAKIDVEIIEFFNTLGFTLCEGYGLTETSPVFLGSVPKNYKVGTVGKPVFNVEVKLVNDELYVRGPIVMKGYYNKPEKTKEAITEDGWLKTGDMASIDEDGYITILGRKNAMIVLSNGKNVDPENLEETLLKEFQFGVKELAFLNHNDKLAALIVVDTKELQQNGIYNISTYIQDKIEFYNAKTHNYTKILEYKIIEEELPKTRLGKLRRFKLAELYDKDKRIKQKENKPEEKPDTLEYQKLEEYIKKLKNLEYISKDDKFEIELGLDSLDLVELISFIEGHFGIKLDEKDLLKYNTLEILSQYIIDNSKGYVENNSDWNKYINNAPVKPLKRGFLLYFKGILYVLLKIYFRLKLVNKDKMNKDGAKIYISNHQSFLDALCVSQMLDNDTYYLAVDKYFKSSFMKFVSKNANVILIDIESNVKESILEIANVLKQGKKILIFPEGSRTKDGNLLPFKKVFAILSKELNVDIEVLKISGAFEAMSRHMKFPRPKKITVEYLGTVEPIGIYEQIVKTAEDMYNK